MKAFITNFSTHLMALMSIAAISVAIVSSQASRVMEPNPCFSNQQGTVYPIAGHCNSYIYCQEGMPIKRICPMGEGFSMSARGCANVSVADCSLVSVSTTTASVLSTNPGTVDLSTSSFSTSTLSSKNTMASDSTATVSPTSSDSGTTDITTPNMRTTQSITSGSVPSDLTTKDPISSDSTTKSSMSSGAISSDSTDVTTKDSTISGSPTPDLTTTQSITSGSELSDSTTENIISSDSTMEITTVQSDSTTKNINPSDSTSTSSKASTAISSDSTDSTISGSLAPDLTTTQSITSGSVPSDSSTKDTISSDSSTTSSMSSAAISSDSTDVTTKDSTISGSPTPDLTTTQSITSGSVFSDSTTENSISSDTTMETPNSMSSGVISSDSTTTNSITSDLGTTDSTISDSKLPDSTTTQSITSGSVPSDSTTKNTNPSDSTTTSSISSDSTDSTMSGSSAPDLTTTQSITSDIVSSDSTTKSSISITTNTLTSDFVTTTSVQSGSSTSDLMTSSITTHSSTTNSISSDFTTITDSSDLLSTTASAMSSDLTVTDQTTVHRTASPTTILNSEETTDSSLELSSTLRSCLNNEQSSENQQNCAGKPMGTLVPYPGDCSKYLICNCEYPTVRDCSPGTWFNPNINNCDWPQNVNCPWSSSSVSTEKSSTQDIATESSIKTSESDDSSTIITSSVTTSAQDPDDSTTSSLLPNIPSDICANEPSGMLLEYDENCSNYILCKNGVPSLQKCPDGFFFNAEFLLCGETQQNNCFGGQTTTPIFTLNPIENICSDKSDGTNVPYVSDCSFYYFCNGTDDPLLLSCPSNNWFNPETGNCGPDVSKTACQEEITTTTITTTSVPLTPNEICEKGSAGESFTNTDNCETYVYCIGEGLGTILPCPSGTYYNPQSKNCGPTVSPNACKEEGTTGPQSSTTTQSTLTTNKDSIHPICGDLTNGQLIPYPNNCRKYISCVSPIPLEFTCASDWVFDPVFSECVNSSNEIENCSPDPNTPTASPPLNVCAGIPVNNTVAYPDNCQFYIRCYESTYILESCSFGEYFDPKIGQCSSEISSDACNSFTTTEQTQYTTTPSLTLLCEGKPEGSLIPYPQDCSQYIKCDNPSPIVDKCETGLEFSPVSLSCVDAAISNCIEYETTTSESTSNTASPELTNPCENLSNGKSLPYPGESCSSYIICFNTLPIFVKCPRGYFYDPNLGSCSNEVSSEACNEVTPTTSQTPPVSTIIPETPTGSTKEPVDTTTVSTPITICSFQPNGTIISVPNDCTQYIRCEGGLEVHELCPSGTHYSPALAQCNSDTSSTACQGLPVTTTLPTLSTNTMTSMTRTTTSDSTTTPTSTTSTPITLCTFQPNGTMISDPNDCTHYIRCEGGLEVHQLCAPGTYYNPALAQCNSDTSPTACNGLPETTTLPTLSTNTITSMTKTTNTPLNPTGTTTTPGKENVCCGRPLGTQLPYPNNDKKFIICQYPVPTVVDCPSGNIYSPDQQMCIFNQTKSSDPTDTTNFGTQTSPLPKTTVDLPTSNNFPLKKTTLDPSIPTPDPFTTAPNPSSPLITDSTTDRTLKYTQDPPSNPTQPISSTNPSTTIIYPANDINIICKGQISGSQFPFVGNCNKYNLCFSNGGKVMACSNDWYFDPGRRMCVPKIYYSCPW